MRPRFRTGCFCSRCWRAGRAARRPSRRSCRCACCYAGPVCSLSRAQLSGQRAHNATSVAMPAPLLRPTGAGRGVRPSAAQCAVGVGVVPPGAWPKRRCAAVGRLPAAAAQRPGPFSASPRFPATARSGRSLPAAPTRVYPVCACALPVCLQAVGARSWCSACVVSSCNGRGKGINPPPHVGHGRAPPEAQLVAEVRWASQSGSHLWRCSHLCASESKCWCAVRAPAQALPGVPFVGAFLGGEIGPACAVRQLAFSLSRAAEAALRAQRREGGEGGLGGDAAWAAGVLGSGQSPLAARRTSVHGYTTIVSLVS